MAYLEDDLIKIVKALPTDDALKKFLFIARHSFRNVLFTRLSVFRQFTEWVRAIFRGVTSFVTLWERNNES